MTGSVQNARNKEVSRGAIVSHILFIEGRAWDLSIAATCNRVVYVGEGEVVLCFLGDVSNVAVRRGLWQQSQVFNRKEAIARVLSLGRVGFSEQWTHPCWLVEIIVGVCLCVC